MRVMARNKLGYGLPSEIVKVSTKEGGRLFYSMSWFLIFELNAVNFTRIIILHRNVLPLARATDYNVMKVLYCIVFNCYLIS